MTIELQTKKALRCIIFTQCVGVLGRLLFSNGFMLAYLARLGIPNYQILFLLSLIPLTALFVTLPFAYLSDRLGKKRVGFAGLWVVIFGLLMVTLAASFPARSAKIVATGILTSALGYGIVSSSWFALLGPIIPTEIRGRFFGKLRISWQATGIVFTLIVTALLKRFTQIQTFQYLLLLVVGAAILRVHFYRKIPEIEPISATEKGFIKPFQKILQIPGYLPFCAYTFLLALSIGAIPWVMGLLGKEILLFNDSQILLLGNIGAGGAVAGFYFGGKMVDRWGTKSVFSLCHIGFAMVLFWIVLRGLSPFSPTLSLYLSSGIFGALFAGSGIAFSSELLSLIPKENKSLSTGFHLSLTSAGIALSSLLIGQALKLNVLTPEWTLMGQTLCAYDTILLGSAVMILLLIITLGLIPSVIQVRKAQWYPHTR